MRYQLELFLTALGFFTRIPVPAWLPWSPERLNHAARYFPLVGWVVGAVAALSFWLFAWLLPLSLAVLLSMALTIRLTGAFHEDGFADACDGLGAGWDRLQILTIMKDSRIGTYGSVGLVLMLLAKAAALFELALHAPALAGIALLVAHPLSRLASTSLIHTLDYVREDESAKSKPLARALSRNELWIAALCGLLPLLLLPWLSAVVASDADSAFAAGLTSGFASGLTSGLAGAFGVVVAAGAVTLAAARLFRRRLGGYTGDCLGAAQQVSELACYLALLVVWKFI